MNRSAPRTIQLLLSCVTKEFGSYRALLRHDLQTFNVTIKVQEDFEPATLPLLDELDDYVQHCEAVIHIAGDMTGQHADPPSVALIMSRYEKKIGERFPILKSLLETGDPPFSYTQWEAYLAAYHGKHLVVAVPRHGAKRDRSYRDDPTQRKSQHAHLTRLKAMGHYPTIKFTNEDELVKGVFRPLVKLLAAAGSRRPKPIVLPYPTMGSLFKGRERFIADLHASLQRSDTSAVAVVSNAVHGLGGIGKTRLAVEYAWQHVENYSAILFVAADTPADLKHNLAALSEPLRLELEEHEQSEDARLRKVMDWLAENPGWLLILDNADSREAAYEAEKLPAKLQGGAVLITSRRATWGLIETHSLDVLDEDASITFLLDRTKNQRRPMADDHRHAGILAKELGYFPLALAQAGAYIDLYGLTFEQYLAELTNNRDEVLGFCDVQAMGHYEKSVALTWQISVAHLSESGRRLLLRFAWFSADPIPEALLSLVLSDAIVGEQRRALADLAAHSLVTRAQEPAFTLHRLVQDITRRSLSKEAGESSLSEAVRWLAAGLEDLGLAQIKGELIPHAVSVLHFLHSDEYRDIAASDLFDPLAQRVIYTLLEAGSREISPQYLARVLGGYYELEPLQAAISKFRGQHPEAWSEVESQLIKENNYVLRYALASSRAIAGACDAAAFSKILSSLENPDEIDEFELAGYALVLIYRYQPARIDRRHLEGLANYRAYVGPAAVGHLLLNLVFLPNSLQQALSSQVGLPNNSDEGPVLHALVASDRFWNSRWELIKRDVWEIEAAAAFMANPRRNLPASAAPQAKECYKHLEAIEVEKETLLSKPLSEPLRQLLTGYFSLGQDPESIRKVAGEISRFPQLLELTRLLFAHPSWYVVEAAASVFSSIENISRIHLDIVVKLLDDENWHVRYGANEAAFDLRFVDPTIFYEAVSEFYDDENCRIRGLCAENLVHLILASSSDKRQSLIEKFETAIRFWLREVDCWVLEHVFRLFQALNQRRVDFAYLLSDGVSPLFADEPQWFQLSRPQFLVHIEERKDVLGRS